MKLVAVECPRLTVDTVNDCSTQQTRKPRRVEQLLQTFISPSVQLNVQLVEQQMNILYQPHDVFALQMIWKRHRQLGGLP